MYYIKLFTNSYAKEFSNKNNLETKSHTQKSDPQNSSILKVYLFENFVPKNVSTDEKLV